MSRARLIAMLLALGATSAAGWASAQAPAADPKPAASDAKNAEQPAKPKAPLKLRLDDATSAAPRITFTPRQGEAPQKAGDTLPGLGSERSQTFEQSIRRQTTSPFPPDTNPNVP